MNSLTHQPIDTNTIVQDIGDPHCGAVVLFVGTTRQWTRQPTAEDIETEYLMYDAYEEMALKQMDELEATARDRWPVEKISMVHRLGRVNPTEPSVAVAVSSPHRSEAFEAARWLIDALKHQVPIWKQEHYVQNGPEWIHPTSGNCSCPVPPQPVTAESVAGGKSAHEHADHGGARRVPPASPEMSRAPASRQPSS